MLYNTNLCFAIKNSCGKYNIKDISMFQISDLNNSRFSIKLSKEGSFFIRVNCPICGEKHYYKYWSNEFLNGKIVMGGCKILSSNIFFIGDKEYIEEQIKDYNNLNNKIYALL